MQKIEIKLQNMSFELSEDSISFIDQHTLVGVTVSTTTVVLSLSEAGLQPND